jgi:TolB-like protein/Tfp pilus assembly protein PilF
VGRKLLYLFEDCGLDTDRRELYRGTSLVSVEPRVFDLLVHVIRNRERVVSKDDLVAAVWNGRIVSESALTTCINAARTAIGDSGEAQRLIKTLPRKGIRFIGAVRQEEGKPAAAATTDATPEPSHRSLALPDKPAIAVLPFTNMSGDPERDYFSDGITEDIITDLSRFRSLFVIARNSSFQFRDGVVDVRRVGRELGVQYVVEGSVRKAGEQLRITAQLVEATAGTHLWSERYDRTLADVFAIQDDVVRSIVASVVGQLAVAGFERSRRKRTEHLGAYDCFLRGLECDRSTGPVSDAESSRWFERALELDPNYAEALARLSVAETHKARYSDAADRFERALALANKAAALDPNNSWCHCALGIAKVRSGSVAASAGHFETAMRLNPNDPDQMMWCSSYYHYTGDFDAQHRMITAAKRLNPLPPPWYRIAEAMSEYNLRHYAAAAQLLDDLGSEPNYWVCCSRAACCVRLGKTQEAKREIAKALALKPNLTLGMMAIDLPFARRHDLDHWLQPIREAGLPE